MVSPSVLSFRAAIKKKRSQRNQDCKGHWLPCIYFGMEIRLRAGQTDKSGSDSSCLSQRNNVSRKFVFPGIKNLILEIIRTVHYRGAWHEDGYRTHTHTHTHTHTTHPYTHTYTHTHTHTHTHAVEWHEKIKCPNTKYETTWFLPTKFRYQQQLILKNWRLTAFTNLISI